MNIKRYTRCKLWQTFCAALQKRGSFILRIKQTIPFSVCAVNITYMYLLIWSVEVERRRRVGQPRCGVGDDAPRVLDVVVAGVDGADSEADDVVVVDDSRYHVQQSGHVDCSQQDLCCRVAGLYQTNVAAIETHTRMMGLCSFVGKGTL